MSHFFSILFYIKEWISCSRYDGTDFFVSFSCSKEVDVPPNLHDIMCIFMRTDFGIIFRERMGFRQHFASL